jgi:hypothetical protein
MAAKPKAKQPDRCDKCRYYHASDDTQGFCRRFPPYIPVLNHSQFPSVRAEWNCGEFAKA